jgi:hypothetical protein
MNRKTIVRVVAAILAATGLFAILRDWRLCMDLIMDPMAIVKSIGPLPVALGLLLTIKDVLKLFAAAGLFQLRRWAWFTAVVLLTLDFLLGLQSAVRICIISRSQGLPMIPPSNAEQMITLTSIIWPVCIISLVGIVSVLILMQKPIRSLFSVQRLTA